MVDWVNAANAVLITSDNEGFGLAAVEALACDVPVLSTPVGIAPTLLGDSTAAWWSPSTPGAGRPWPAPTSTHPTPGSPVASGPAGSRPSRWPSASLVAYRELLAGSR